MATAIRHITVDCHDPLRLARFWGEALGFVEDPDGPNLPGEDEALVMDPHGLRPGLLFIQVPEPKSTKNRIHLDLEPELPRDAEVERLLGLGATLVDDRRDPDGTGWAVLADPEGNELCVERSAADRGRPGPVDTGERAMLPDHRTADERAMLEAMLDWYRAGVVAKVQGIDPRVAATSPVRSGTTVAGLVKHLALVEESWFCIRYAGLPERGPWADADWDADPDWEFHTANHEPMADLVALYELTCQRSRDAVADRALDDVGADTKRGAFSLRFVYLHLIEETARHLGHLDVLREVLDGTTGE